MISTNLDQLCFTTIAGGHANHGFCSSRDSGVLETDVSFYLHAVTMRRFMLCPELKTIYSFNFYCAIQRTPGPHHHACLPTCLLFLSKSPRDRANFYMVPPHPFHNHPVCVPVVVSRQVLARRAQQVDLILFCHHLRNLQGFCEKGTKPQPPPMVFINLRQSKATTRAATISSLSFLPSSCWPVPSCLDSVCLQQGQSLTGI